MLRHIFKKALPRPRFTREIHELVKPPPSGPPSYDLVRRRYSSNKNPDIYYHQLHHKELADREGTIDIHAIDIDHHPSPSEYDVILTDLTHEKLKGVIAEQFGIPYLSNAPPPEAQKLPKVTYGTIYGPNSRAIIPLVVTQESVSKWVFFILDSGCLWNYVSAESAKALGMEEEIDSVVRIAGRSAYVQVVPVNCHFMGCNVLGSMLLREYKAQVLLDYKRRSVGIFWDSSIPVPQNANE